MSSLPVHEAKHYPYGERRLPQRLMLYWEQLKGDRLMPEENDIDPDVLGPDWDYCFVLQTRDLANVTDYNFTYLGKQIIAAHHDGRLDGCADMLVSTNARMLSSRFARVLETKAPVLEEGEFLTTHGRRVFYRQCILPLGNEKDGVLAFFGGMYFKFIE